MMGRHFGREAWTKTKNQAVPIKRDQVHVTWHYPGFGNSSVKTAGWSLERCFAQLRAWRNMHVGSGAYREVAYNLYALPTGDVVDGRGNRQNGANGKSTANRAGMSVQVLIGDNEPMTAGHLEAIAAACVLLERWHPGITRRQYPHNHWVGTRCPGPYVGGAIPFRAGSTPAPPKVAAPAIPAGGASAPAPAPAPAKKPALSAPAFPLPRRPGRMFYYGPPGGPINSVSGRGLNTAVPADVVKRGGRWRSLGLAKWQDRMRARGYTITADGRYGDETARIVRYFQGLVGLKADGKIGPGTWAAAWTEPVR